MVQTPRSGTGDSVGWFRRDHCWTLINNNSNLSMCGTFLKEMLPPPDNRELLPMWHRRLSAAVFSNWQQESVINSSSCLTFTHTHTCTRARTRRSRTHKHIHTHARAHTRTRIRARACTHTGICIHVCMHIRTHVFMYTCTYAYTYICIHVSVSSRIIRCTRTRGGKLHAGTFTYIHTNIHTCIRTYIHTYIHTYLSTCMHIYR